MSNIIYTKEEFEKFHNMILRYGTGKYYQRKSMPGWWFWSVNPFDLSFPEIMIRKEAIE